MSEKPLLLALTSLGFASRPIYLGESGGVQISDALFMMASSLLTFFAIRTGRANIKPLSLLALCVPLYFILVNTLWALYYQSGNQVPYIFYGFFYVALMLGFSQVSVRDLLGLLRVGAGLGAVILVIQFALGIQNSESTRLSLGFNNPNQLGLYCIWGFLISLIGDGVKPRALIVSFVYVVFALLSLSKAAIIAIAVSLVLIFTRSLQGLFLAISTIVFTTIFFGSQIAELEAVINAYDRLSGIGQSSDDSIVGRGYDYILSYPSFIVVGAGEGFFLEVGRDIEIHSLFGTLLFSYGLPSFVLFLMLVFYLCVWDRDFLYIMLPVALYSITHNIIRDEMLWIFIIAGTNGIYKREIFATSSKVSQKPIRKSGVY